MDETPEELEQIRREAGRRSTSTSYRSGSGSSPRSRSAPRWRAWSALVIVDGRQQAQPVRARARPLLQRRIRRRSQCKSYASILDESVHDGSRRCAPTSGRSACRRSSASRKKTASPSSERASGALRAQSAKILPGLSRFCGSHSRFEPLLPVDHLGRLLPRHVARLGDADAVLARQRAAEIQRRLEQLGQRRVDARLERRRRAGSPATAG